MDQRWAHIAALFERAIERHPSKRQSFVRKASADDSDLRHQVEGLLAEDGSRHLIDGDFPGEAVAWLTDNAGAGTTEPRRLTLGGRSRIPIWSACSSPSICQI
jgi:hypothetical protein